MCASCLLRIFFPLAVAVAVSHIGARSCMHFCWFRFVWCFRSSSQRSDLNTHSNGHWWWWFAIDNEMIWKLWLTFTECAQRSLACMIFAIGCQLNRTKRSYHQTRESFLCVLLCLPPNWSYVWDIVYFSLFVASLILFMLCSLISLKQHIAQTIEEIKKKHIVADSVLLAMSMFSVYRTYRRSAVIYVASVHAKWSITRRVHARRWICFNHRNMRPLKLIMWASSKWLHTAEGWNRAQPRHTASAHNQQKRKRKFHRSCQI